MTAKLIQMHDGQYVEDPEAPSAKRARYGEEWSSSSGSSPSNSLDVQENTATELKPVTLMAPSAFTNLMAPRIDAPVFSFDPSFVQPSPVQLPPPVQLQQQVPLQPVAINQTLSVSTSSELINHDSKFNSYTEFEDAFERWKKLNLHPFRVASSETLREPDGSMNYQFRYRYVVYHCAHYGEPRMRGNGKRPNQNYLPCGCRAMLRVNYNFNEKCLKVTTLNNKHNDHEVSEEMYLKVSQKIRRHSSIESPMERKYAVAKRSMSPSSSTASPSSYFNPLGQIQNSMSQLAQLNQMASLAASLQQQQQMLSYLQQHKENIETPVPVPQFEGLARPKPQNPMMSGLLNLATIQQQMMNQDQPAHANVAPIAPIAVEPTKTATNTLFENKPAKDEPRPSTSSPSAIEEETINVVSNSASVPPKNLRPKIASLVDRMKDVLSLSSDDQLAIRFMLLDSMLQKWKAADADEE